MFKSAKCLLLHSGFAYTQYTQCLIFLISIFICAINIKNGACAIPEVSQEGPLRSFKSYQDVVMFHYNVPKQVFRATWQFLAFSDDRKCPQRKVNIFLKWGSYPVIAPNNATYPPHMYVENSDTLQISTVTVYDQKSATIVPIYSPQPGDWFVGAYLSHWDEEVHQKGLGHQCHYTLGSVALWSETTGIQNIPLGYQKTMKTTETISYYKIFIPSDTGTFQVDIWGCNFTVKTIPYFRDPCIKNLDLKARVLPIFNHSNPSPIGNLTSTDTYTFTEFSPFQDDWYYLMIVSSSAITFNIKVTIFDCPIRTTEEVLSTKVYHLKNPKEQFLPEPFNHNQFHQELAFNYKEFFMQNDSNLSSCIPRYQLVRIKYPIIFSGEYLIQSREWLTPWLSLTDTYPVITQFNVLPLVDIGGTLKINIALDMGQYSNKQQVNITICVHRGNMPKQEGGQIKCDNKHMTMQLSNHDIRNTSLLIPYPQPDTWFIAFQAICYVNRIVVHCNMEQILVRLKIILQPCVFEENNSCGQYGVCEQIHKGLLYYTACKCFGGWQGWGCTDSTYAISEFFIVLTTLFLTLSNLFFIPAIYLAFKRKFYTEGLIYFCIMSSSALYHACDQQLSTYCIAKFEVLQYCDFFFGNYAFWITLVAMAEIPVQYESFFHALGVIIITFGIQYDKTGLSSTLVPITIGSQIPLTFYGFHCYKMKKIVRPKRIIKLTTGLSLAVVGILLFSLIETESNYQYVHSAWHVIIALSIVFLLPPMKEDQTSSNKPANDLLSSIESPDNSLLSVDAIRQDNHLIATVN